MRRRQRRYDRHGQRTHFHRADDQRRHSSGYAFDDYIDGDDLDGDYHRLLGYAGFGLSVRRRIHNRRRRTCNSGHSNGEHDAR